MNLRQNLVSNFLLEKIKNTKVGIIIKGINQISPKDIVKDISEKTTECIYASIIGYDTEENENKEYVLASTVEKAVLWRSMPECSGKILVFIKNDSDKLHSLAEFDVISMRDLTEYIIDLKINEESNTPTINFWKALKETSDYYSFDAVEDFIIAIDKADDKFIAIPNNMWILGLLCDKEILGTKNKPLERLKKNRDLIVDIGQLSETSRKKLSRSLARANENDKDRLQQAYRNLQNFFKYGKKDTLKKLDFNTVQELFSATKTSKNNKKKVDTNLNDDFIILEPIKQKELDDLISDAVISGDKDAEDDIKKLLNELKKHFDSETEENITSIPTIDGIFNDRDIIINNHQTNLRKIVGKAYDENSWGGILETKETALKDAIAIENNNFNGFIPTNKDSIISFNREIEGKTSLFDFIICFDELFEKKGIESTDKFKPVIEKLIEARNKLLENLDLIMYYPVLTFGADSEIRKNLVEYIDSWSNLYQSFCANESNMRQASSTGTSFVARALLLLDVLYIKTPTEWKGILLPLHPMYLWRYYEIFKTISTKKAQLEEDDINALKNVVNQLPQILSFLVANKIITGSMDIVLPYSGNIEMLPTFENRTNRYLGDDGTQSIGEILTRWIGFAPYTRNEIRICTVDAPDLIGSIRSIKEFMDKNECQRVIYDVYLTRDQNGNNELSKLEYSGKDYEIGEFIKNDKIFISIHDLKNSNEVSAELNKRPVHIAFYFDQSSYSIEYGPNNQNLYINPLVITYDYEFDEVTHRGRIYPSSDVESGIIGDYHKIMKSADIINNNMSPRTAYNSNMDTTSIVSTIKNKQTQWLVVADRDTNNYNPEESIPIGEMKYDKRMVNVWTSSESRIITQYITMLRGYNLYPRKEALINILRTFGHIASNGLISIPKFGADSKAIENKKKGLLGTLFAAVWYTKTYENSLIASLDDEKAKLWLHNSKYGNERADLIGLRYDELTNTLYIQPIEVKTRDESPDATITIDSATKQNIITGHAADQIASVVNMLKEIFGLVEADSLDMFISARREVLKYQIISECFRNIHNADWQKQWSDILKMAFDNRKNDNINISISGMLLYFKLSDVSGGKIIQCINSEYDDCHIEFVQLTSKEIQEEILGEIVQEDLNWIGEYVENTEVNNSIEQDNLNDVILDNIKDDDSINYEIENDRNDKSNFETIYRNNNQNIEVSINEIEQLARDFKRSCGDYNIKLEDCEAKNAVVGPGLIRLKFKLLRGQALQGLKNHLEDIGREMKRSGIIVQEVLNSDELLLDVPRLKREKVLFKDVIDLIPKVTSPEQLYFPLGRTPNGDDLIENIAEMPHMLVGGSTGSGKSVFLFTVLASLIMTHPKKEDMQLILSSSKLEDFIYFENLPHLYSGNIISDAVEATRVIKEVVFKESERRGRLLAEARVSNIVEYNKKSEKKLAPIVVIIDEFADLVDQLETKKEQNAFFKPIQRIAQAGRSRGIHLIICTQRPEAKLVPSTTKAQLNARVALRVNDGTSSRMIIETSEAQYLQKHGDMIYKNGDIIERAQGYLIEIEELDKIVESVIKGKY